MGRFFVGVMVVVLGADAPAAHAEAKAKTPPAATKSSAAKSKRVVAGFRMEGDPAIEMVFGDTERYKQHVDKFYELHQQMRSTRADFQHYVRATQTTLSAHKRRCPSDAVAPLYVQAYDRGQEYRELGAEFEAHYSAIKKLDKLGETSGLTPDYRWRVNRTKRLYRAALVDYREMRAVFDEQLADELSFRHCKADELLAAGRDAKPTETVVETEVKPDTGKAKLAAATFFIDTKSCDTPLAVYVDGALLGEVASGSKAAFQAQPGRHAMCLIPGTSDARCGDAGTVRSAHVHDGWSMSMRCD
jgi:hypothetical protein